MSCIVSRYTGGHTAGGQRDDEQLNIPPQQRKFTPPETAPPKTHRSRVTQVIAVVLREAFKKKGLEGLFLRQNSNFLRNPSKRNHFTV
jgi:hypothetical protein